MTDYQHLSEAELKTVIECAENALKMRQERKRKEVIAKIRELAASINVSVDIQDDDQQAVKNVGKVPIKYRHPKDPTKAWTGRGITPKWLQELLAKGHDKSEFLVKP
jgi:DNA-binding protein H-NS